MLECRVPHLAGRCLESPGVRRIDLDSQHPTSKAKLGRQSLDERGVGTRVRTQPVIHMQDGRLYADRRP